MHLFSKQEILDELHENLNALFHPRTRQRGLELYIQKHVSLKRFEILDETLEAYAIVLGSGRFSYEVFVTLLSDPDGYFLDCECSCPVGIDCKHAAATLFALMDALKGTEPTLPSESRWKRWLRSFPAETAASASPSEEGARIHYLIRPGDGEGPKLQLLKTRPLKRGGYSKGSLLPLEDTIFSYGSPDYFRPEDLEIMRLLRGLVSRYSWESSLHFKGEVGSLALRRILETGRAYLPEDPTPLRWDDTPRSLSWRWRKLPKLDTIGLYMQPAHDAIFPTRPLLALDTKEHVIHPLETPFGTDQLRQLAQLPPIPREELEDFARELVERFPSLPLPLPEKFLPLERIESDPIPVVLLGEERLQLRFDYDGQGFDALPFRPLLRRRDGERLLEIRRREAAERDAILRLEALGFRHEAAGHFLPEGEHPLQRLEPWRHLLESARPGLELAGWRFVEEAGPPPRFDESEQIEIVGESDEGMHWFELGFKVEIDGQAIDLVEPVSALLHQFDDPEALPERVTLPIAPQRYLTLPGDALKPIVRTLFELHDRFEGPTLKLAPYDAHLLDDFDERYAQWHGAHTLRKLQQRLKDFRGIEPLDPAPTLQATLREYQRAGLSWLGFLHQYGFGGILADDMGLGKTLQTLAFLQRLKHDGALSHPALVIVPTSLLGNWRLECSRFTPDLRLHTLYGSERHEHYANLGETDLVLTTYATAQRDAQRLVEIPFSALILDEAQKIKNPRSKIAQAVKRIEAPFRLALTGTPMENHLGELWSIFDFLMPGFLGTLPEFRERYQLPIEKREDRAVRDRLRRKIAPFMLRRTKEEVLEELPEKIVMVRSVAFGKRQAALYESIRIAMEKRVREEIAQKGLARSQIVLLDALLKLRQVCCDPALLELKEAKKVKESAKRELLFSLLEELIASGRKILLFSQFTTMLDLLSGELEKRGIPSVKLTGRTRKRQEVIDRFKNDPEIPLFLISLKAGGVGLNLVEADTVIHYDPWWNPAVEAQATDRAYRIGQTRQVDVYKLIVEGSIEEKILQLQEKKAALQRSLYQGEEGQEKGLDAETLLTLLREA